MTATLFGNGYLSSERRKPDIWREAKTALVHAREGIFGRLGLDERQAFPVDYWKLLICRFSLTGTWT